MKKIVLLIISVLISGIAVTSCDSDNSDLALEHACKGTYTTTRSSDGYTRTSNITVELLKDGTYKYQGIPHSQGYGSGKYSFKGRKITFELISWNTDYMDENGMLICLDMDPNFLLVGEYMYTFDGSYLKFSKTFTLFYNDSESIYCEYVLKKNAVR